MKVRKIMAFVCTVALVGSMFGCASSNNNADIKETISASVDESSKETDTTKPKEEETTTEKFTSVVVKSINISKKSVSLKKGETTTLTATVSPSDARNKSVTWSSSNTSVATVNSSGKVTAVGKGTATIIAKTEDGGKSATCTVNSSEGVTVYALTSL